MTRNNYGKLKINVIWDSDESAYIIKEIDAFNKLLAESKFSDTGTLNKELILHCVANVEGEILYYNCSNFSVPDDKSIIAFDGVDGGIGNGAFTLFEIALEITDNVVSDITFNRFEYQL